MGLDWCACAAVYIHATSNNMAASNSPPAKKSRKERGSDIMEDPAVTLFRDYVRIPSVSRGDDYQKHYGIILGLVS